MNYAETVRRDSPESRGLRLVSFKSHETPLLLAKRENTLRGSRWVARRMMGSEGKAVLLVAESVPLVFGVVGLLSVMV